MIVASALIFAARLAFTGWPLATATICNMLINAGAAAARMESSVDTQAVEQAVQNIARDRTTTRSLLINSSPLIRVTYDSSHLHFRMAPVEFRSSCHSV